jgi:hypothetical protein
MSKKSAAWQPFQKFDPATSSAGTPFLVRAKGRRDAEVAFNSFGQLIETTTGHLLDWEPEQQSEAAASDAPADES